jgi:hypothetical protein
MVRAHQGPVPRTRLKVGRDEGQLTNRGRERSEVAPSDRWLERNHTGFVAFEQFVEKHGIFNEDDREW